MLIISSHACIGHPVNFEGSGEGRNNIALQRLAESYGSCGYSGAVILPRAYGGDH